MIHPDGTPLLGSEWPSSIIFERGEAVQNYVAGYKKPDGSCRWMRADGAPIYKRDGTISHVVISFIDVTDRVLAEQRSRESEERLQLIMSNLPVTIFVVDRMGMVTLLEGKGSDG